MFVTVCLHSKDYTYTTRLFIPPTGLMLKTRVFAEVRATNLTERYFAQFEIMNYVINLKVVYDMLQIEPRGRREPPIVALMKKL